MSDFVKSFVQKVIENPACINWYYFLNFGVAELSQINNEVKSYLPVDSKMYLQLHDVATKSLKGKQIDYELILKVMSKLIWVTRGRVECLDEYISWCNRLYDSVHISPGPLPDSSGSKIEDLDLSVRSYNCLKRAEYTKIDEVIRDINTEKFENIKGLSDKCRQEIEEAIRKWTQLISEEIEK